MGGNSGEEMGKMAEEIRDQRERLESSRNACVQIPAHKLIQVK